ncbi:hypothetical protein [Leeuwenhoekiella sp. MAR_2009_132]|uniref:hypothetical protein n=1 Tax=Leeuwenhoekiella sp. MAR_2009_132 TaxID=1392489 RepID=UPI0004905C2A|nr:hypothetical protein [Leeuwenhoekiella sp. MAR_2009_132]
MKVDMILVFAIVVGLVAVPYALFIIFGSGNSKKVANQIKEESKQHNLNINQQEKWSSRHIALDSVANKLLFARTENKELIFKYVDLNSISRVAILEHVESKRIDGKTHSTLEKLSLEFISAEHAQPVVLNFYNSETDATQNYEVARATKWKTLIENQLNLGLKKAKAA